jgi:hypothetical protein
MFPPELERDAFRADNGEFGWTRAQIPMVVGALRSRGMGILGGELWWVHGEPPSLDFCIPQRHGPPAVYTWAADRLPSESWVDFVEQWPDVLELPPALDGRIVCSLTWVSEHEYEQLARKR